MAKLIKTVTINAPIEDVFNYVEDPNHLPEFWSSLIEVSNVQRLPNGGTSNGWIYKMAGLRFDGSSVTTEYNPPHRWVYKTEGIKSTQAWIFKADGNMTQVTFETEYNIPIPLLGKLAEAFIVKMNEHEVETLLANLKTRMES
jgi:uncharacterized protein YndB with AHSA1/START domain